MIWYRNIGSGFIRFVLMHTSDGQTKTERSGTFKTVLALASCGKKLLKWFLKACRSLIYRLRLLAIGGLHAGVRELAARWIE